MSDHTAVITMIDVKPKPNRKAPHQIYLYKRADFDKLRDDLLSFSNRFLQRNPHPRSLEENWTQLKEALLRGIKGSIPMKMTKENQRLPWINRDIQKMIRQKACLCKKAKQSKCAGDWTRYTSSAEMPHRRCRLDPATTI